MFNNELTQYLSYCKMSYCGGIRIDIKVPSVTFKTKETSSRLSHSRAFTNIASSSRSNSYG